MLEDEDVDVFSRMSARCEERPLVDATHNIGLICLTGHQRGRATKLTVLFDVFTTVAYRELLS